MFGGSDSVSGQVHTGLLAGFENVMVSGPLRNSVNACSRLECREAYPVKITDTEMFRFHDGGKDSSRVGRFVMQSNTSGLGIKRLLLGHISFLELLGRVEKGYVGHLGVGGVGLVIVTDDKMSLTLLGVAVTVTVVGSVVSVILLGVRIRVLIGASVRLIN